MAAKKPPKKSATPENKEPRKFPPDKRGGYIGVDDAAALNDGETRVKKSDDKKKQEKERIEELKVSRVLRKMDDQKPPDLPK